MESLGKKKNMCRSPKRKRNFNVMPNHKESMKQFKKSREKKKKKKLTI